MENGNSKPLSNKKAVMSMVKLSTSLTQIKPFLDQTIVMLTLAMVKHINQYERASQRLNNCKLFPNFQM